MVIHTDAWHGIKVVELKLLPLFPADISMLKNQKHVTSPPFTSFTTIMIQLSQRIKKQKAENLLAWFASDRFPPPPLISSSSLPFPSLPFPLLPSLP